ncbi:MAG: chloride channel protein [Promethearchaeota archaeon]|nr:MAG: chloride channel protein [Candidatus Lokiarchaeota archaeon]
MEDQNDIISEDKSSNTYINWFSRYIIILIISCLLGAICGFVMVGFNYLLNFFKLGFSFIPYFIAPLIAGALTSLLVKKGVKNNLFLIMGTGAAQFITEATGRESAYDRFPVLLSKTLATSWTYGSGMLCGKEGPGLLIGANLGYIIAKRFKRLELDLSDYFFIGASACTSAILRTPISGALFCAELPYSNHIRYKSLLPSIFASIIAFLIFSFFFEFKPLIKTDLTAVEKIDYITLLPLLIFFGILTGLIMFIIITCLGRWMKMIKNHYNRRLGFWKLPLIGAALYSVFLFIVIPLIDPQYKGVLITPDTSILSFITSSIKDMHWLTLLILIILFLVAILFSIGFYNSAGIILPLMLLGALIGGLFGVIFYPEYPELFVILGISAVLGASINNPITAIILIVEMTWEPYLFIPAGIVTILAYIFSGPNSIIPGQRTVKKIKLDDN